MNPRKWIWVFLMSLTAFAGESSKTEGLLNKLLAPGPLMEGHHSLGRSDCLKCHTPQEGVPSSKCLGCHQPIADQVTKKKGFHGLQTKTCIECHSDHKGINYDSTQVDQKIFNHLETGYQLEGKHSQLQCIQCHTLTRKSQKKTVRPNEPSYLGAGVTCLSCHKKNDVHHFPVKSKWARQDCGACHGNESWTRGVNFDHYRETHFKFEGAHKTKKCAECHTPKDQPPKYRWPSLKKDQCLSCHKDFHSKRLSKRFQGGNCVQCHTQDSWKIEVFKHQLTGYTLRGAHEEIDCKECHIQNGEKKAQLSEKKLGSFTFIGLKKDCLSCHKDQHLFGNHRTSHLPQPNQCTTCHSEVSWKEIHWFDHDEKTRYPIHGKHVGLQCDQCHTVVLRSQPRTRVYFWPRLATQTCESCHASPHKKVFPAKILAKRCTECHVDTGWMDTPHGKSQFNHSVTRFPLTGRHEQIRCEDCHGKGKNQKFKFSHASQDFCISCHKNIHLGQFSSRFSDKSCSECHTTKDFLTRKTFDHAMTRFKVDGAHKKLVCNQCHTPTSEVLNVKTHQFKGRFIFSQATQPQFCSTCHENVHKNQFHKDRADQACNVCHSTEDFRHRYKFNHEKTQMPLRGRHAELTCDKCHTATQEVFPNPPHHKKNKFIFSHLSTQSCTVCHKDYHEGKFGKNCLECHNEKSWKATLSFHKNFNLIGVHLDLTCAECHGQGRRFEGMSQNCKSCHQKDDVHNGTLPSCGSCHRQYFWEQSRFNHSLTLFPLRGTHRTLDCYACHSTGLYKGLSKQCVGCHLNDALSVTSPPHTLLLKTNCSECHNEFSFQ